MTKRARGTGSITPHQGGFWARLPVNGAVKSLGVHPTRELAEKVLNDALITRAERGAIATQMSFASFGELVLNLREEEGIRGVDSERGQFRMHLAECAFADKPVADVTSADIADLMRALSKKQAADERGARKIKKATVQRLRAILNAIFKMSVERGLRVVNPCVGVQVKGTKREIYIDPDDDQTWDWLRGEEQRAFLECPEIEDWFKNMVRVAWGTGLRQGEQWNLELKDIHLATSPGSGPGCSCGAARCLRLREHGPHIHVRYGSKGHLPPKNGCVRSTPLFGEGLAGMRAWLALLPSYAPSNPERLAFPTAWGNRRQIGAPVLYRNDAQGKKYKVDLLRERLSLIGIERNIRWHDLRHTCASSLVSGSWGQRWALLPTRDMLGHKDIKTTQRYAHLSPNVLHEEGANTPGHVTSRVIPITRPVPQLPENTEQTDQLAATGTDACTRTAAIEQDHDVRFIPNTSIALEAARELVRLVGEGKSKEALRLALSMAADALEEGAE